MQKLGDLVNIKTGKLDANAANQDGLYPFFTCAVQPLRINKYAYNCECVLVAGNGDLNVKYYDGKFNAYQRVYIIESIDKKRLDTKFLTLFLDTCLRGLRSKTKGAVIQFIRLGDLTGLSLVLPSFEDQIQIANILYKAEDLISKRKESIRLLDEFLKSTFLEMFGDGKNFEWKYLEEVVSKEKYSLSSGPFGSNLTSQHYTDKGVIILRGTNITSGKLDLSNVKYISEEKAIELKRSEVKPNDVVIIAVGSSGKALLVPPSLPRAIMSQNFNKVTPDKSIIEPEYLVYCINDRIVQQQFKKKITDTVRTFLSLTSIKEIKIPVPALSLQTQFAQIVEKTEALKIQFQQNLQELENLYGSLSQWAFMGELKIQD